MSKAMKPILIPTSAIVLPVGDTADGSFTVKQLAQAMGICNAAGELNANIEAIRLVGITARMAPSDSGMNQQAFVKFAGGQTYQLCDPYHYAKLKVSDRNPLGFWKTFASVDDAFTVKNVDIGSVTIAVRYKNVNFL